jgi:glyoxylase-like metal-dependent hydrolase (beta-lactamase superfamily II)
VRVSDVALVERLELPTPFRVGAVNSYLVEADRLTLVDAGPNTPEAIVALERGLEALGRRLEEIDLVLVTHQHYDHSGLASLVRGRSGAELAAAAPLADYLADVPAAMDADDAFAQAVMAVHGVDREVSDSLREGSRSRRRYGASAQVDRRLVDGDLVDLGGTALRALWRPGHSPTDTIFVDESAAAAFVGDHLIGHISSNPVLHRPIGGDPDPRRPPHRLSEYLASLRATAALGLSEALSGHGTAVAAPAALVERRISRHVQRKERIHAELAGRPRPAAALIDRLWPNLARDQIYLALSEILGHVGLLLEEGRAAYLDDGEAVLVEAL